MPCSVRNSCSVTSPRWNRWRIFRTIPGRFGRLRRNPHSSSWPVRCAKKFSSSALVATRVSLVISERGSVASAAVHHSYATTITACDRFSDMKSGLSGNRTSASAWAISSLSNPARSGPNSTPARSPRPPITRNSAAAPRAVSTGLMMWRGRGQVANTWCRSETASATVSCTVAQSSSRSAPEQVRHAFSCGQPSRGATNRR